MLRLISPILLGAVLTVPVVARAGAALPGDKDHRTYDRDRKDYHNWDDREDRAYRHWLEERHYEYRAFERLDRNRQAEYWRWRHDHADWDGPRRVYVVDRREWRNWDDREERAYRFWLGDRRIAYVTIDLLPQPRQIEYWRWRQEHADWDGPNRAYDNTRRDWHPWDEREERAYRYWIEEERHERYVEFDRLASNRQRDYWRWRHDHPNWDRDHDRDRH
jgi:hypothetical protein